MNITISPSSILNGLLFVVGAALLFYLRDIILIVLTAVVLASSIEPAVQFFMRHRLNRILAVLAVYLLASGAITLIAFLFVPPLIEDMSTFLANLPEAVRSLQVTAGFSGSTLSTPVLEGLSPIQIAENIREAFSSFGGGLLALTGLFFGGIMSFIIIVVFSFYFAVQETGIDDFLRLIVPTKHQDYALSLWRRSQEKIGKWMQGQILLALLVGILLYLGLVILGVKYALLLAILAMVCELIPVFGQIIAAIPAIIIAFTDGGVTLTIFVASWYLIVQQFEAHLFYPLVVKKVVGVPPILVILALLVGGKLAGFLGILLSVPIAAALQELVHDIQIRKDRERARLLEEREVRATI